MQKVLIALACTALMGLSACTTVEEKPQKGAAVTPDKPTLSAEAKAALSAAQADVKAAKAKNALWTTADEALKAAEAAAEAGDSATVLKQTATVRAHVKLGMDQLNYPTIPLGN